MALRDKIRHAWFRTRVPLAVNYFRYREPNALMFWVPKTAGTSISTLLTEQANCQVYLWINEIRYLFPQKGLVTFGHFSCRELLDQGYINRGFFNSAYRFGFVRNPFDRAVSLYKYFARNQTIAPEMEFIDFCRQLHSREIEPVGLYNLRGWSQANPQVEWFRGLNLSYIGRTETISEGMHVASDALKLQLPEVPVVNQSEGKHKKFSAYYCDESKDLVRRYYLEDFEAFGYDPDDLQADPSTAPVRIVYEEH